MSDWILTGGSLVAAAVSFFGSLGIGLALGKGSAVRSFLVLGYCVMGVVMLSSRGVHVEGAGPATTRLLTWSFAATFVGMGLAGLAGIVGTRTPVAQASDGGTRDGAVRRSASGAADEGRPVVHDFRTAERTFNEAKSRSERYASRLPYDVLDPDAKAAEAARASSELMLAEQQLLEVVAWCRTQTSPTLTGSALVQLGMLYNRQGRDGDAGQCLREADRLYAATPNTEKDVMVAKSSCHFQLGALAFVAGELDVAERYFRQGAVEAEAIGVPIIIRLCRDGIERVRRHRV